MSATRSRAVRGLRLTPRRAAIVAGVLVMLALPFYLDGYWLLIGILAMSAGVGAIGLNLLVGSAGQLSLAHGFFIAVGAYTYCLAAGESESVGGGVAVVGLGLPPLVGAVVATAAAGVAGLLFSPVASRIRGIYLGLASLALVFLGQHVLFNASDVTGGFNGRPVPDLSVAGFELNGDDPALSLLQVPFGERERMWYVALACLCGAALFAVRVLAGRPGRALALVRDNEIAAAAMGIPVARYKRAVFVLSSLYAGLAGVLLALAFQRVVPEYFGLALSVDYLAMVVIGGLGSVLGAGVGAAFVTALPLLLSRYSSQLPLLAQPGESGVDAGVAARFVYGAVVVALLLSEPGGLVAAVGRLRRRRPVTAPPSTPHPGPARDLATKGEAI